MNIEEGRQVKSEGEGEGGGEAEEDKTEAKTGSAFRPTAHLYILHIPEGGKSPAYNSFCLCVLVKARRHELFNDVTFRHRHRHSTPYSDKFRHGADTVPTRPDMT